MKIQLDIALRSPILNPHLPPRIAKYAAVNGGQSPSRTNGLAGGLLAGARPIDGNGSRWKIVFITGRVCMAVLRFLTGDNWGLRFIH